VGLSFSKVVIIAEMEKVGTSNKRDTMDAVFHGRMYSGGGIPDKRMLSFSNYL